MSSKFTVEERELILQFLTVLHGWIQDTKRDKQNEIDVLRLQEGLIKLLYARINGDKEMTPEEIIISADSAFEESSVNTEEKHEEGKVIDIATWIRSTTTGEKIKEDENDELTEED